MCYFFHVLEVKSLVAISLDEVIERFAGKFKYKARVLLIVRELILQLDKMLVCTAFFQDVSENFGFDFGGACVPIHCTDNFHGAHLFGFYIFTF